MSALPKYANLVSVGEAWPASSTRPSAGPAYRHISTTAGLPTIEIRTLFELFERSVQLYSGNDCLGTRPKAADGSAGAYKFQTYAGVGATVIAVASGLRQAGVMPQQRIGIFGSNCAEWMMAMQGCNRLSLHCVPLYDSLGENAIEFIITHSEASTIFVAADKLPGIIRALPQVKDQVKLVVYWGVVTPAQLQAMKACSPETKVSSWEALVELGKAHPAEPIPPKVEDLCTIMYTSGTTGDPKGVMLTHHAVVSAICSAQAFAKMNKINLGQNDAMLSYLPLAHIFDRVVEEWFLYNGGRIGYFQGDVTKLVDDIAALQPALFVGVPRVFDRIYSGIKAQVDKTNWLSRFIFNWGYRSKLSNMEHGAPSAKASPVFNALVFNKVAARMGGKIKAVISGGAPLAPHVEQFLRVIMCAPVVQGYGLTETCALSTCADAFNIAFCGTVGPPFPLCDIRLESVPDMNADALHPTQPRGEVLLKGPCNFSGYYKDAEKTDEAVDEDGWFHTGDVGLLTTEGALQIVDRKKNIFKLSQGEYVAPEKLEASYKKSQLVDQIWVYGNSYESVLVALVVPSHKLLAWAKENNVAGDMAAVCADPKAIAHTHQELLATGKGDKLRGYELIKAVCLQPAQWTLQEGLMTPTFKLKRPAMQIKYQDTLDSMYKNLSSQLRQQQQQQTRVPDTR